MNVLELVRKHKLAIASFIVLVAFIGQLAVNLNPETVPAPLGTMVAPEMVAADGADCTPVSYPGPDDNNCVPEEEEPTEVPTEEPADNATITPIVGDWCKENADRCVLGWKIVTKRDGTQECKSRLVPQNNRGDYTLDSCTIEESQPTSTPVPPTQAETTNTPGTTTTPIADGTQFAPPTPTIDATSTGTHRPERYGVSELACGLKHSVTHDPRIRGHMTDSRGNMETWDFTLQPGESRKVKIPSHFVSGTVTWYSRADGRWWDEERGEFEYDRTKCFDEPTVTPPPPTNTPTATATVTSTPTNPPTATFTVTATPTTPGRRGFRQIAPAVCYEPDVKIATGTNPFTRLDRVFRLRGNGELLDLFRNVPELQDGKILSQSIEKLTRCWVYAVHQDKDGETSLWKVSSDGSYAKMLRGDGNFELVEALYNGELSFTDSGVVMLADANAKNPVSQNVMATELVAKPDGGLLYRNEEGLFYLESGKIQWDPAGCFNLTLMPSGEGFWCSTGTELVPYYFSRGELTWQSVEGFNIAPNPYAESGEDLVQYSGQIWMEDEVVSTEFYHPAFARYLSSFRDPEWEIDPTLSEIEYDGTAIATAIVEPEDLAENGGGVTEPEPAVCPSNFTVAYDGSSIVEFFTLNGEDSSLENRQAVGQMCGIDNIGTADGNEELLNVLIAAAGG